MIRSRDPVTDELIRVRVEPGGRGGWQPPETVVVAGTASRSGHSYCGCYPVLNFFASRENASRWLGEHPEVRGDVISLPDAIEAGRIVFGDALS